jgi:DNA invertase Pin-like site-specific DNA recombinase
MEQARSESKSTMKAVGYCRVSTEEQAREGVSLAAQEEKIRAYASLYDLDLVKVIWDAGVSAKSLDRPGLYDALALLNGGEAEALVIAKLDRLTRSVADWGVLIERHFAKRHALLSVADQIDTRTAAGRLVLNVLVSVAQWEREAIGERTAAALAYKKSQGEHVGRPPYGFTLVDRRLVPVREQHDVAIQILELRREGLTLQGIAEILEAEGVPTQRGGRWQARTVSNILSRELARSG